MPSFRPPATPVPRIGQSLAGHTDRPSPAVRGRDRRPQAPGRGLPAALPKRAVREVAAPSRKRVAVRSPQHRVKFAEPPSGDPMATTLTETETGTVAAGKPVRM